MNRWLCIPNVGWLLGGGLLVAGPLAGVTAQEPVRITPVTASLCAEPCVVKHTTCPPRLPKGAIPAPNGSYVRRWAALQSGRADLDAFVIYRYEWYANGMLLTPSGTYHLSQIALQLSEGPFEVRIQPEVNAELNEVRRTQVVNYLLNHGVEDAPHRVKLGRPEAEGLYGEEAERIFQHYLQGGQPGVAGKR